MQGMPENSASRFDYASTPFVDLSPTLAVETQASGEKFHIRAGVDIPLHPDPARLINPNDEVPFALDVDVENIGTATIYIERVPYSIIPNTDELDVFTPSGNLGLGNALPSETLEPVDASLRPYGVYVVFDSLPKVTVDGVTTIMKVKTDDSWEVEYEGENDWDREHNEGLGGVTMTVNTWYKDDPEYLNDQPAHFAPHNPDALTGGKIKINIGWPG